VELLHTLAAKGERLARHLETSTVFSGFSNIIQNDLIEAIGDVIRYDIKEISAAPFFAAEVDESTIVTNKQRRTKGRLRRLEPPLNGNRLNTNLLLRFVKTQNKSTLEELQQENKASGGCDQSSNFAQFCTEMHVFNRGFSYVTHFWYNPACFKTAARIGYICSD